MRLNLELSFRHNVYPQTIVRMRKKMRSAVAVLQCFGDWKLTGGRIHDFDLVLKVLPGKSDEPEIATFEYVAGPADVLPPEAVAMVRKKLLALFRADWRAVDRHHGKRREAMIVKGCRDCPACYMPAPIGELTCRFTGERVWGLIGKLCPLKRGGEKALRVKLDKRSIDP